jgi:hypothetical protein
MAMAERYPLASDEPATYATLRIGSPWCLVARVAALSDEHSPEAGGCVRGKDSSRQPAGDACSSANASVAAGGVLYS